MPDRRTPELITIALKNCADHELELHRQQSARRSGRGTQSGRPSLRPRPPGWAFLRSVILESPELTLMNVRCHSVQNHRPLPFDKHGDKHTSLCSVSRTRSTMLID